MSIEIIKEFVPGYFLIINIISFLLFAVDRILHDRSGRSLKPLWIFALITVIGGSVGANLYFLLFFNSFNKQGIGHDVYREPLDYYHYWRIFAGVLLVLHILLIFLLYGIRIPSFPALANYLPNIDKGLIIYLCVINIIAFLCFAYDKWHAAKQDRIRVKELHLYLLALAGGSAGSLLAMKIFRHKIRKMSFAAGVPLILLLQVVLLIYLKWSQVI